jgi:hypothetical protein
MISYWYLKITQIFEFTARGQTRWIPFTQFNLNIEPQSCVHHFAISFGIDRVLQILKIFIITYLMEILQWDTYILQ